MEVLIDYIYYGHLSKPALFVNSRGRHVPFSY